MKILHVETGRHFYGGAQQVIYLLDGLCARGTENVLVCPPQSGIDDHARRRGATVINLPCAGDVDAGFVWRLWRLLRHEKPDIVHCHSRRGADLPGGLAAAASRLPAVLSRRVDHAEPAMLARLRYAPYRCVIAISGHIGAVLREAGLDAARITVIRSAVDAEALRPGESRAALREALGLEDGHFAIAAIGQLIPRKGHRYLLKAMASLLRQAPRARLLVFGRGPLESALETEAARLGIADAVRFAGFRDDLDRHLAAFDLIVHPALHEGLGVALLKAAAAGKAVVAFDIGGVREAVEDGTTGLLVPPQDTGALARAILSLMDDPVRRHSLGEAGRQRVRSEFSIATMVEKHLHLYESILDGPIRAG